MFRPEVVIVERKVDTGARDGMNHPLYDTVTDETLALVAPYKDTKDVVDSTREGTVTLMSVYFQKSFNVDLRHARVCIRGDWYNVIGAPAWYSPDAIRGLYNYCVEVERCNG